MDKLDKIKVKNKKNIKNPYRQKKISELQTNSFLLKFAKPKKHTHEQTDHLKIPNRKKYTQNFDLKKKLV